MIRAGKAALAPSIVPTKNIVTGNKIMIKIINGTALSKLTIKSNIRLIILFG